jgi:beta-galactosidase
MVGKPGGVLFGVDYYPEQWDRSLWKSDAKRMAAMGIQAARMMEFAWSVIEPREGKYDFSLFDDVIELLAGYGIRTVLGTPTATFPAWLAEKDERIFRVHPSGIAHDFGTRREYCYNSRSYQKACEKIVTAIARHYGANPNVIGWQVDNEIGHEGTDRCICENCVEAWHKWLKAKYGEIEALNKVWGTIFWGTTYTQFEQVPVPRRQLRIRHNPGLLLDYDRFCSDSAVGFTHKQTDILHAIIEPRQWVSTNFHVSPHSAVVDDEAIARKLERAGFDNYPVWGEQEAPLPYYFTSYQLSHIRGLKDNAPISIFEQFSGIQGHWVLGYLPPDPQVVLWSNQSIAHGADQIFYFRWRTAPFGQEQLCYGILDPDNTITSRYEALAENIRANRAVFDRFAETPVEAQACVLYDKDNSRLLKEQYLSEGLYNAANEFMQVGYDMEMARYYAPYNLFNVNADVKSVQSVDLSRYKIISLPLYQMADPAFVERLAKWVNDGGHLILSWRTGARDLHNQAIKGLLPGLFTEMAGVKIRRFEALGHTKVKIGVGIFPAEGEVWADILEPVTARVMARYTDRKKHYRGAPCVTVNMYGKGRVYYMGTSLGPLGIFFLYRKILKDAGVGAKFHGMGIEVVRRRTIDGSEVDVILNHTPNGKRVRGVYVPGYGMRIKER